MIGRRFVSLAIVAAPLTGASTAWAQSDPLPSWNGGAVKKAILDFVARTTTAGADFVPIPERIATFDNDGTLWSEQPVYFQFAFAIDRVKAQAAQHPEWKDREPFKSVLAGDMAGLASTGQKGLLEIVAATHAGQTTDDFRKTVEDWIATARHPRFNRPYVELVYQPMLELLAFLRANQFRTFIVSGGGVEFMRPWTEKTYGIPPEQVVGSSGVVKFELRDGKTVLIKEPQGRIHRRRSWQAGWHQPLHRPPAGAGLRQLRRRPADAAVYRRRHRRALHGYRPSHRRRARVRL